MAMEIKTTEYVHVSMKLLLISFLVKIKSFTPLLVKTVINSRNSIAKATTPNSSTLKKRASMIYTASDTPRSINLTPSVHDEELITELFFPIRISISLYDKVSIEGDGWLLFFTRKAFNWS